MSPGRTARRACPIASTTAPTVRAAAERNAALSLLKSGSIGFRSGLYAGKHRTRAPAASISRATSAVLWQARLSITTMSPGRGAGTRH